MQNLSFPLFRESRNLWKHRVLSIHEEVLNTPHAYTYVICRASSIRDELYNLVRWCGLKIISRDILIILSIDSHMALVV